MRWKLVLKYWRASDDFVLDEIDVTQRHLHLDGPMLELLAEDGAATQTFGPGQPYDCWVVELRTWVEK
jgi:hypothetical protein